MSAPPETRAEQVTIAVRLRPRLAAFVHTLAEQVGVSDRQMIAMVLEDLAQRGAVVHGKRHSILVRRRPTPAKPAKPAKENAA